jgi:hypothetical protein
VEQLGKKMRRVSSTTKMVAPAARMTQMRSVARPAENLSTQMKVPNFFRFACMITSM